MFALPGDATRAVTVLRTFLRHGALFPLKRLGVPSWIPGILGVVLMARPSRATLELAPGGRLAQAMSALGPAFSKIGQALSVRPDLVGEQIAKDLSVLRDRMEPVDGAAAVAVIEAEFGRPLDELFSTFDHKAFAAASIAQVHKATTSDGKLVAVKVLRPGVEAAFSRDLKLAARLAGLIERHFPDARRLRPRESMETIIRSTELELDLRFEAAAAEELRLNFEGDERFRVPAVDWRLTGRRVLTLNWVDAVPMDQVDAIKALGLSLEDIVVNLARVFFLQVFRDGFFHADLHQGNLFIDPEGAVHVVDFGIMGRLDRITRHYLAEMLHGFLTGDYRRVARAHRNAGYVPAHFSEEEFAQAARSIAEPIFGLPLGEISLAHLLSQLFEVTDKFEMQTQPQLLLLQKTMLVAEGVGRSLCPDTNIWELARPLIEEWMSKASDPEVRAREATEGVIEVLQRLRERITLADGPAMQLVRPGSERNPSGAEGKRDAARSHGWQLLTVLLLLLLLVLVVD